MLILGFDTTSEYGGVTIYRDFECLGSAANEGVANYSVTLFQTSNRLLEEARLSLRDIELFAVANGPGSFTGIRVGLAAAQGWARAFERPVVSVSVLEAMVEEAQPETDRAVPVLDARRGEFYLGVFRRSTVASPADSVAADTPAAPQSDQPGLREPADEGRVLFASAGEGLVLKPPLLVSLFERLTRDTAGGPLAEVTSIVREQDRAARELCDSLPPPVRRQTVPGFLVHSIARLALRRARQGRVQSPARLDAYYIRRSDAELNWREEPSAVG